MITNSIIQYIHRIMRYDNWVLLWIVTFLIYYMNFRTINSGDTYPAALLPFCILGSHSLNFDQFASYIQNLQSAGFTMFVARDGHYLSFYPIVLPVLITVFYVIPFIALKFLSYPVDMTNPGFFLIFDIMEKISASAIASLSVVFVYLFMRELIGWRNAFVTALIYAFATNTWVISSQALWQHGLAELLLSAMIYIVFLNEKKESTKNIAYLGLLSGLFIFNRPSNAFLLLPILIYVMRPFGKNIIIYALSAILSGGPFLIYNVYYFGSILGGYSSSTRFVIGSALITNLMGSLISPSRGLLVYTPIVLLSLFGLPLAKGIINLRIKNFIFLSGLSVLLQSLIYAGFVIWWAGWSYGPRYFTDCLPYFALYIGLFLDHYLDNGKGWIRKPFTLILAILLIWSVLVQVIGAFYFEYQWDADSSVDTHQDRLWNFTDTQILRAYHSGPILVSPLRGIYTISLCYKDIINNPSDTSTKASIDPSIGWNNLEIIGGTLTRWMSNDASIQVYSNGDQEAALNFRSWSFQRPRILEIYVNGKQMGKIVVPATKYLDSNNKISLKDGQNRIRFHAAESCDRPRDNLEKSDDLRCLSIAFQDIYIR